MASRMKGNASWTSPRRMVSVSTRPPTKPAMSPAARPEAGTDEHRRRADQQRVAAAVHQPAGDVPPEGVGAEQVLGVAACPDRRGEDVGQVLGGWVVRRHERRENASCRR